MGKGTTTRDVSAAERRRRVLGLVRAGEFMRIPDLAERFGVSTVTMRSDLDMLAERGDVVRLPGGAIPSSGATERAFEARQTVAAEEKVLIAEAVVGRLESGDSLILDVGTTTMAIAHALVAHTELENLVVFTNGLNVALALEAGIPRLDVMVTGGHLRPMQHSLVEPQATGLLQEIRADYAFIGCDGIHPARGVTTTNLPEAAMKQAMLRAAHQRVVVADSRKFLREALSTVCPLHHVDSIVTAGDLGSDVLSAFSDSSVEVRAARGGGEDERVYRFGENGADGPDDNGGERPGDNGGGTA